MSTRLASPAASTGRASNHRIPPGLPAVWVLLLLLDVYDHTEVSDAFYAFGAVWCGLLDKRKTEKEKRAQAKHNEATFVTVQAITELPSGMLHKHYWVGLTMVLELEALSCRL